MEEKEGKEKSMMVVKPYQSTTVKMHWNYFNRKTDY